MKKKELSHLFLSLSLRQKKKIKKQEDAHEYASTQETMVNAGNDQGRKSSSASKHHSPDYIIGGLN